MQEDLKKVEISSEIDESLYSRQLYVLDVNSMKRIINSDVLIIGLKGVGTEIGEV